MPILDIQHLGKEYPTPTVPLVVLKDCSFRLEGKENLVLIVSLHCCINAHSHNFW